MYLHQKEFTHISLPYDRYALVSRIPRLCLLSFSFSWIVGDTALATAESPFVVVGYTGPKIPRQVRGIQISTFILPVSFHFLLLRG